MLLSTFQQLGMIAYKQDNDLEFKEFSQLFALALHAQYINNRTFIVKSQDFFLNYLMFQPPSMLK